MQKSVFIAALAGLCLLASCSKSSFRPLEREGPPALVQKAKESRL